jgi:hypothetical protein
LRTPLPLVLACTDLLHQVHGVYVADGSNSPVFRHVAEPGAKDLQDLVERIAARAGGFSLPPAWISRRASERSLSGCAAT